MFKYQLFYFWQSHAYFGKLRFDGFSINGCDIESFPTEFGLAPLMYKRYVHDSHTRSETVHKSSSFLNILNKQNKAIQYKIEKEDQSQKPNFLDVTIMNTGTGKHEFKMHQKNAITNVWINHICSIIYH